MATAIVLLLSAVLLNGFSAGIAAALFLWREGMARGQRIAFAALATGVTVCLLVVAIVLVDQGIDDDPVTSVIAMLFFVAVGAVMSLPGAVIISRRIERDPRVGDTFR